MGIDGGGICGFMFEEIQNAVTGGKPRLAAKLTEKALESGIPATDILNNSLLRAMHQIGLDFGSNDTDIARVLACARAMKMALEVLEPEVRKSGKEYIGKAILGTAGGDLHDVGKNIVAIMFESIGCEVVDLGVDVPAERFVQAVEQNAGVQIVCVSCLLTTSMAEMRRIVRALREIRKKHHFVIMVGGGPVTREFAKEIGADIYTENAAEAAETASDILRSGNTQ